MLLTQYANPRYATWSGLQRLQSDVERLFGSKPSTERTWLPALEVTEGKESFLVALELPSVKSAEVKVTIEDDVLTVSGERKYEAGTDTTLRLSERSYGKFERSVQLPAPVQADQVKAASKDGILTITLPKTEEARPREIKIAVA
jgi:HSP20 family protein